MGGLNLDPKDRNEIEVGLCIYQRNSVSNFQKMSILLPFLMRVRFLKKNLMIQRKEEEKWKKGVEECRNWEGENIEVVEWNRLEERKKNEWKKVATCVLVSWDFFFFILIIIELVCYILPPLLKFVLEF